MLSVIKIWAGASAQGKVTQEQEPCLIGFCVPKTNVVPVAEEEPWGYVLNECTDLYFHSKESSF